MVAQRVSLVIPCYNEEEGISQLVSQLNDVTGKLDQNYALEVIFVDDGSKDKTNELLHRHFGDNPAVKIVKHEKNQNLGAALKTGFSHAHGELIAAWDSDCTYPLHLLPKMLEMIDDSTDIVTVSPYHPEGKVKNVPAYRIFLSKSVSKIYRLLLRTKIYTYTAMVRIHKREVIKNVRFNSNTFLGVTEMMVKALLQGYKVKELPAELNVRQFGASKMKTVKVIKDHLGLISEVILYRIFKKGL